MMMAQNLAETNIQPSQSENLEQLSFSPTFPPCLARMKRKTSSYGKVSNNSIDYTTKNMEWTKKASSRIKPK